jgi:hypothetical protein
MRFLLKGVAMKTFVLCVIVIFPVAVCLAQTEPPTPQQQEPQLYDHFVGMEQTQQRLSQLSLEEKERLQPKIRREELQACQRLRKDQQEGVREDDYRRQGGDVFVAYVLQFEKYCETLR